MLFNLFHILAQIENNNIYTTPWRKETSLLVAGSNQPGDLSCPEGSMSQYWSTYLQHISWGISDALYEIIDSGINHEPERLAEPYGGLRLGNPKPSLLLSLSGAVGFYLCPFLYIYFFFLSPWARFMASLCTWQKILPHNPHICKFFQLKHLIKIN